MVPRWEHDIPASGAQKQPRDSQSRGCFVVQRIACLSNQEVASVDSASSAGASDVSSGASAPASAAASIAFTVFAGKPEFFRAATAFAASNLPASTDTVAVVASASISTFATPGSDCNAPLTVARQPPQVMPGQKNSTFVAEASGSSMATSVEAGSVEISVVLSGTASGALPCVQPIAAARRSVGKYFVMLVVLCETNVCLPDRKTQHEPCVANRNRREV